METMGAHLKNAQLARDCGNKCLQVHGVWTLMSSLWNVRDLNGGF